MVNKKESFFYAQNAQKSVNSRHFLLRHGMFMIVLDSLPRTNNSVEGWHSGFQRSLMCSHPTVWRLIEQLKKEEAWASAVVNDTVTCWTNRAVKKLYRTCNTRISNVVHDYSNRTRLD